VIENDEIRAHLQRLAELPGLTARREDHWVALTLGRETRRLAPMVLRSNLTREMVDHAVAQMGDPAGWLLLAPWVSRPMAAHLVERGAEYIDAAGNCHLEFDSGALLHVEGRPMPRRPAYSRGVRGAGYRVLFALLADRTLPGPGGDLPAAKGELARSVRGPDPRDPFVGPPSRTSVRSVGPPRPPADRTHGPRSQIRPPLLAAPLRQIAEASGASRQAVSDMLARMTDAGWVVGRGRSRRWMDSRLHEAVQRWVAGYLDVLRPELILGAWRLGGTRALPEKQVYDKLGDPDEPPRWRWGGTMAAGALTGYYEGRRYVLHASAVPPDFGKAIGGAPDPDGDFLVVAPPGPMAFMKPLDAGGRALAHPLLIHAESLVEGTERAREVATMVLRWCDGLNGTGS